MRVSPVKNLREWSVVFFVRAFRIFGALLLSLLGIVSLALLLIFIRPQLILNEHALRIAAGLIASSGPVVTWNSVEIDTNTVSWLQKRVTLNFSGLCVREHSLNAYNGCFDRARLTAAGGLQRWVPKLTEIGPIAIQKGNVVFDLQRWEEVERRQPKEKTPKKRARPFQIETWAPRFLRNAKIFPIELDVSRLEIRDREKTIRGSLALKEGSIGPASSTGVQIQLEGRAQSTNSRSKSRSQDREQYQLSLHLINDQDIWAWNQWRIQGAAEAHLADRRAIQASVDVRPRFVSVTKPVVIGKRARRRLERSDEIALQFAIEAKTQKENQKITARANGSYAPGQLQAQVSGSANELIREIPKLSLNECDLSITRVSDRADSRYVVDCGVTGSIPFPPERLRFLEIPTEAGLRVQADLTSSDFIPSDTTQLEGSLDVVATPILSPIFQGRGEIHSRMSGVAGEFPRSGQLDSKIELELRVPDFQKLSRKLRNTAWGIPAPFQALEGDVTFRSAGTVSLEEGILPLRLRTRLTSVSQNMDLDADGTLEVSDVRTDPKTQLNFGLTLSNLKILLPRLQLEKPPRFVPDDRIHTLAAHPTAKPTSTKTGESKFGYRAAIRTPPGKPVQVITNLARGPIPIHLDITLANDSPPVGKVNIGTFPVEAFRRKATVQRFDINLVPQVGDSAIDGRLEVPLGDYRTFVDVVGSIDKPKVKVTSEPPIGEDQLLAALLFNRTPEELDPNESVTVGSTRATVSQGALSLASLFLLASTPIEALTYNPDTGQVTAQVRLSEGLSLNVGSGEKQAGAVGLRKRLGSNFFVTTDVNNIIQNSSTVSAYVEWRKRY
jgi:hypothetical protein